MTSKHKELESLHWELSQLYRKGSADSVLIEDYWSEIIDLEEELGVEA